MVTKQPPTRLVDDATASASLRSMLGRARGDLPDAQTLSNIAARVDAAIAAGVAAPALGGSAAVGAKSIAVVAGIVVGSITVAGIWFGSRNDANLANGIATAVPLATAPAFAPSPVEPLPPMEPTTTREQSVAVERSKTPPRVKGIASSNAAAAPSEAQLLHDARSKLSNDPQRALTLAREHAQRFPTGALTQEREVIAIEALRRLGQADAAKERGAEFERRYPESAHRSKVEQTIKNGSP